MRPFNPLEWKVERKTVKELSDSLYDGSKERFSDWRELMRTHLIACKHGYGRIIHDVENDPHPLTLHRLCYSTFRGLNVDVMWISRAIWAFMAQHMTIAFQRSAITLVGRGKGD